MTMIVRLFIISGLLWACTGMECDETEQEKLLPMPLPCGCADDVTTGLDIEPDAVEAALAEDVWLALNEHRLARGLRELEWYAPAAALAQGHSDAMLRRGFFDHLDPCTCFDQSARAAVAGIAHDNENLLSPDSMTPFVGEVIYRATRIPNLDGDHIVRAWEQSPEHRVHIEAPLAFPNFYQLPNWTHMGVGVRIKGDDTFVTAMFFKNPIMGETIN